MQSKRPVFSSRVSQRFRNHDAGLVRDLVPSASTSGGQAAAGPAALSKEALPYYSDPLPRVATLAVRVHPSEGDFREICPMDPRRSRPSSSPVRVRQESPTLAEAVAAAQALTPDLEQQVDITAGLMGVTPDEARPFVLEASPLNLQRPAAPQRGYTGTDVSRRSAGPVVVVERRSRVAGHEGRSGRSLARPWGR